MTRRVESSLPVARHDRVAAPAMIAISVTGIDQPPPVTRPTTRQTGTCSHRTTIRALLVVSRKFFKSWFSAIIFYNPYPLKGQASGNGFWVNGKPGAGCPQPGKPGVIVGPHDNDGGDGGGSYKGGVGGSRGLERLLRVPPGRKHHRDHVGVGAGLEGK